MTRCESVFQQITPHTTTPYVIASHLLQELTNTRAETCPGRLNTHTRWLSALSLNDSSLKITRVQPVTLQLARSADTAYEVGIVVGVLMVIGSL
ncbi:hypothetical protein TNCV_4486401 [Trichonephila clavipes]|nr:hypothetical protein TNCV_4486401 [Trichonephila clavipes]